MLNYRCLFSCVFYIPLALACHLTRACPKTKSIAKPFPCSFMVSKASLKAAGMALERHYEELQFQEQNVYKDLNNHPFKILDKPANQENYQNLQFQYQTSPFRKQQTRDEERFLRGSDKVLRRWRATAILSLTLFFIVAGLGIAFVAKTFLNDSSNKTHQSELQQLKTDICVRPGPICEYCSINWYFHNTACYFLHTVSLDWPSSKQSCEEMEAHLAVINNEEEERFLENHGASGFWIGLSKNKRGIWTWVDGTTLTNQTSFWSPDQPDNRGGTEECALIFQKTSARGWNDDTCIRLKWSICERGTNIYHDEKAA